MRLAAARRAVIEPTGNPGQLASKARGTDTEERRKEASPMPKQDTRTAPDVASMVKRAIDLERELTEADYATNSEALKRCTRAWKQVRDVCARDPS